MSSERNLTRGTGTFVPIWPAGCRQGVSLARGDRQTRPPATTGGQTRRTATAGGRFGLLTVAEASVWPAGCRQGVSLAGGDGQSRPPATTGAQTLPSATTGGQTRRAATAGGRFGLLTVAGASVWPAGCRRGVSLARGLSPGRQSGWRGQADSTGGDNWRADSTVGDNWRTDSTGGDSWGPIWPPYCRRGVSLARGLSPGRQSG